MRYSILVALLISCVLVRCSTIPSGIKAVKPFDPQRYTGTWYEIARLENSFEKNLSHVTANYAIDEEGNIAVSNKGWNDIKSKWVEIEGKAKLATRDGSAMLKVSFFGPFYGGYNVIALDSISYNYAMVCGSNKNYLWILSRSPILENHTAQKMISYAGNAGFDTSKLTFVNHTGLVSEY